MQSPASSDSSGGGAPLWSPRPSPLVPPPLPPAKATLDPVKSAQKPKPESVVAPPKSVAALKKSSQLSTDYSSSEGGGAPIYPLPSDFSDIGPARLAKTGKTALKAPSTLMKPSVVSVSDSDSSDSNDYSEVKKPSDSNSKKPCVRASEKSSSQHVKNSTTLESSKPLIQEHPEKSVRSSISRTASTMARMTMVPYTGGEAESTIDIIKDTCKSSQALIITLQSTIHSQPGITSQAKDMLFAELRDLSGRLMNAQRAATTIETENNIEMSSLRNSLRTAENERDLLAAENSGNLQELQMLRDRLEELKSEKKPTKKKKHKSQPQLKTESGLTLDDAVKKCENWVQVQDNTGAGKGKAADAAEPSISALLVAPTTTKVDGGIHDSMAAAAVAASTQLIEEHKPQFKLQPDKSPFKPMAQNTHAQQLYGGPPTPSRSPRRNATYGGNMSLMLHQGNDFGQDADMYAYPPSGTSSNLNQMVMNGNGYEAYMYNNGQPQGRGFIAPNRPHRQNGNNRYASNPLGGNMYSGTRRDTNSGTSHSTVNPQSSASNVMPTWAVTAQQLVGQIKPLSPAAGVPLGPADERWNREMFSLFEMIKDWVKIHCSYIDEQITARLPATAPTLWNYICQVTFPNNRNSAVHHSRLLLNDPNVRPYFISRLLIQFVVQQMWSPDVWEGLDDHLSLRLRGVRAQVERARRTNTMLSSAERYSHVDQIGNALTTFLNGPDAGRRKSQMITAMSLRLKNIINILMDPAVDREGAMWDLNLIAEQAIRISALINTSRLSFSFIFNESGVKFSDQSHYALNTTMNPRQLQHHRWRITCVVTPGITYRDDASGSVQPKFIAKSNVLVME